ncbi:MAG: hypothetical protein PHI37_01445 [Candidatus Gracilibacteria bacterium]|nr:hypothetical protein [Candidatus Gracilibacteria bacterium]
MNKSKKAFSILLAMGLVLISSLLAYIILEYMVPFGKNISGIENSTKAYYQANNGIELGLYFFSHRSNLISENSKNYTSSPIDYKFSTISSGPIIPRSGFGTSDYNKDWDIISLSNPIQLSIGNNYINSFLIDFRSPTVGTISTLSGVINWQLSGFNDTLNSGNSYITASNINGGNINLWTKEGKKLDGSSEYFSNFYATNCRGSNKCILKFSVINDLKNNFGSILPYLERKVTTNNIPLRYSIIQASGKSNGFTNYLQIKVPQETVSEAFDFTIFQ